jgi:hypothetical protein
MMRHVSEYFARLAAAFGQGWTRFWFTPSDPAVLSAIRMLTGLVVVYLHATLAMDLIALFGPQGLLPASEIAPLEAPTFSYLNYLSTPGELWAVHLLGLAVLVAYAVGFWTRITSGLALVVFLSDVNRAVMITGRTELLCAMVMLYTCLGPSGRYFSLDQLLAERRKGVLAREAGRLSTVATIATRLIQVHLALLVAMMGFSKLAGETWWLGTGAWWLVARADSRLIDLSWLHAYPKLLDACTHAVVLFELTFPILIWVPLARPLLLALGFLIWTSLALVTGDITFGLMLLIASLSFVRPSLLRPFCTSARREDAGRS